MEIAVRTRPAAAPASLVRGLDTTAAAVPLFGTAMFFSGFLLFLVEPMVARMVLPILGGVPMVWNGCVVFFQMTMLVGYGYAFVASRRLPLRGHVALHALVLASPALVLPVLIRPASVAPPAGNPLPWLLALLAMTIGLPFFVLSTTASVLQDWLSRTDHPAGADPYFLYAASNAGCLLALAAYPLAIEPSLTVGDQSRLWAIGYALFALLVLACGVFAWRHGRPAVTPAVAQPRDAGVTNMRRVRWTALAFVPSSLMLAVTSYISTDVAAVPLLWIVPLAVYLLTFALAFGRHGAAARAASRRALPLLVVPLVLFMIARVREPLAPILLLHLGAFAAIGLACHGDLAADRPGASHVTEFYFWLSFGGMLGGLFNTLLAPRLFDSVAEYPLIVVAGCLLASTTSVRAARAVTSAAPIPSAFSVRSAVRIFSAPAVGSAALVGVLTAAAALIARGLHLPLATQLALLAVPALLTFGQRRSPVGFGWAVAALLAAGLGLAPEDGRVLHATRTFFGVYRVNEDVSGRYHGLAHGTTLHGLQSLDPARRGEALTYYHSSGPFGEAWRGLPSASKGKAIAVVGLGVGTLASYATPDQQWTFFEIDPAIEQIARTPEWFSFLQRCGDRCRVVAGDARMSLARVHDTYDLIVLDAFSSDSIPLHLMTREAMDLYLACLTPGGALVMHVSNRHLRLAPIVGRLAADRGLSAARRVETSGAGWPEGKSGSDWIALSRNPADIAPLIANHQWQPLAASPSTPLWTDDFSNILSALRAN
jgi:hypothetical protein